MKKSPFRQTTLALRSPRAESDLAGGGLTEGGFLYNAMNDFLEAIQQVILVLKFFQAPQQYDDFPKTLFDQVAP